MDDGAALKIGNQWLVMTTDSHVVQPLFFPGGDIGRLAVSGTVNDLAMMGATEVLALTCAVIIEEGFSRADLTRIQQSIQRACADAGARIVTGDTKVMGKGELDGIVINTTGVALTDRVVPDASLRAGDRLIVTGSIGDHGMAVMAHRLGLAIDGTLESDVNPINAAGAPGARCGTGRRRGDEGPDARRRRVGSPRDGGEERRRHHHRRAVAAGLGCGEGGQRAARDRSAARRERRQGGDRRASGGGRGGA